MTAKIGALVEAAKTETGETQGELASRLGVSRSTIDAWKAGRTTKIDLPVLIGLCDAANVSFDSFFETRFGGKKSEIEELRRDLVLFKAILERVLIKAEENDPSLLAAYEQMQKEGKAPNAEQSTKYLRDNYEKPKEDAEE